MAFLKKLVRFLAIFIIVLSVVTLFQNDQLVSLKFLFWKKEISLYFLTGFLFLAGILIGFLISILFFLKGDSDSSKNNINTANPG